MLWGRSLLVFAHLEPQGRDRCGLGSNYYIFRRKTSLEPLSYPEAPRTRISSGSWVRKPDHVGHCRAFGLF